MLTTNVILVSFCVRSVPNRHAVGRTFGGGAPPALGTTGDVPLFIKVLFLSCLFPHCACVTHSHRFMSQRVRVYVTLTNHGKHSNEPLCHSWIHTFSAANSHAVVYFQSFPYSTSCWGKCSLWKLNVGQDMYNFLLVCLP